MRDRLISIQTGAGRVVTAGEWRLVPLARSISCRLPGSLGGLIWSRPVAVEVTGPDGRAQVLPIRDVTRWVQVMILLGAAVILLAGLSRWAPRSRST
ncbi:MAG: hypothetical protein HPY83_03335 [Anaerolineae bacterium]|nr:hypothetical protein [Anaerolineae bacterium]